MIHLIVSTRCYIPRAICLLLVCKATTAKKGSNGYHALDDLRNELNN